MLNDLLLMLSCTFIVSMALILLGLPLKKTLQIFVVSIAGVAGLIFAGFFIGIGIDLWILAKGVM